MDNANGSATKKKSNKDPHQVRKVLISVVLAVVVTITILMVMYIFTGWTEFSYEQRDDPVWTPDKKSDGLNSDVSRLRFYKDCMFTVVRSDGETASLDVRPNLNSMAIAYEGGTKNPPTLMLTAPLNPFSFTIAGFNDVATVEDPAVDVWSIDSGATATLSGYYQTI